MRFFARCPMMQLVIFIVIEYKISHVFAVIQLDTNGG
jgi:hypothetical protein